MFGREMFFTAQKETSSQPYLADCAGHQYRLQFNAYRYMIEKNVSYISMADKRKAFLRMRMYVSLPPCDSTISKRAWESAIYQQR